MGYTFSGRYSRTLEELLNDLGAVKELKVDFEDDYQGYVAVDALLSDGRVFSYKYSYGSCSGCDEWEDRDLTPNQIKNEMFQEATLFDDVNQYERYLAEIDGANHVYVVR